MFRPGARMSAAEPADSDALHDGDELRGVAPPARSDQQGQRAGSALSHEVDLAGEAAPGASESLFEDWPFLRKPVSSTVKTPSSAPRRSAA
ncbi:hypothetical protein ACM01_34645 [Streptomyces viridochromogenes]|uniref:Uncharacterized protein n=1 Tax=Streptomyces viridochromogenes TaxID=1938 RepID=A0A0J7Z2S0_STRVR|nr:hypothetical protein ACM01_34645 [Streptomyces viridochromogenes]KOG14220.1 hypothetical protein ADK35_31185 [Streptomyces viridochromogenes]KOG15533.1 hypothetical protein ADK36_29060 [Streptomyces viridochromogenes]